MNYEKGKYQASINIKIKTYEIDIAGHVNNIVYIKWLEDLRFKLFEQILPIDTLLKSDLYPAVVSTEIVYKRQLKLNDTPTGYIRLENIKHNIMFLKYNFLIDENICAFATQNCVFMNIKNGTMDKQRLSSLAILG